MKVKEVKCQKWESGKVGKFVISLTGVFRDKGYMVTAVTVTSLFSKKTKNICPFLLYYKTFRTFALKLCPHGLSASRTE